MAIKVIAQRREVKLGKKPGMKFVMRPDLYIPIAQKKVFAETATHSGISSGVIKAAWDAAGESSTDSDQGSGSENYDEEGNA